MQGLRGRDRVDRDGSAHSGPCAALGSAGRGRLAPPGDGGAAVADADAPRRFRHAASAREDPAARPAAALERGFASVVDGEPIGRLKTVSIVTFSFEHIEESFRDI